MYEALLRDRKVKEKIMHLANRLRDKACHELIKNGIEERQAARMADSHWSIWHRGKKVSPGLLDWYVMASGLLMDPEYGFVEECSDEDSMVAADYLEDRIVDQCVSFHIRRIGDMQSKDYQPIAPIASIGRDNASYNTTRVSSHDYNVRHHDSGGDSKSISPELASRSDYISNFPSYSFPATQRNSMGNQRG